MIRLIKTFHFQTPRNCVAVRQSDWSLLYLLVLSSFLCQMHQTAETSFAPQSSSGVPQVYVLSPLTLLYIRHSILSLEMNPAHTEDTAAEGCFQQPQMPLYTIPLTDEHTFPHAVWSLWLGATACTANIRLSYATHRSQALFNTSQEALRSLYMPDNVLICPVTSHDTVIRAASQILCSM